jgi:dienelactone hydrolase
VSAVAEILPGNDTDVHGRRARGEQEAPARLAWERTIAFFKKHLA